MKPDQLFARIRDRWRPSARREAERRLSRAVPDDNIFFGSNASSLYRDRYDYNRDKVLAETLRAWRINPVARNVLSYYPMPNQAGDAQGRNNFFSVNPRTDDFYSVSTRIDHRLTSKQQIMGRYVRNDRRESRNAFFGEVNGVMPVGNFLFRKNDAAGFEDAWVGMEPTFQTRKSILRWREMATDAAGEDAYFESRYMLRTQRRLAKAIARRYEESRRAGSPDCMFASVEPNRSPTPMSILPSSAALTSVVSSGKEVLAASSTVPIHTRPSPVASAIASACFASRAAAKNTATASATNAVNGTASPLPVRKPSVRSSSALMARPRGGPPCAGAEAISRARLRLRSRRRPRTCPRARRPSAARCRKASSTPAHRSRQVA